MDYAHDYPNATILYHASDMCLHIDSNAACLVHPRARSIVAGHFYLSDKIPLETPNKQVQSITGTFQYYTKGIDPTMIVALNEVVSQHSAPTQ